MRVLVVEDDFANQRVASLFLQRLGFETDIAENGEQALAKAQTEAFQLILMDCQMPVMDGFEATRQIRLGNSPNKDVPIIALTANVVSGIDTDCGECGMNDILNKPVKLGNMREVLSRWIQIPQ